MHTRRSFASKTCWLETSVQASSGTDRFMPSPKMREHWSVHCIAPENIQPLLPCSVFTNRIYLKRSTAAISELQRATHSWLSSLDWVQNRLRWHIIIISFVFLWWFSFLKPLICGAVSREDASTTPLASSNRESLDICPTPPHDILFLVLLLQ